MTTRRDDLAWSAQPPIVRLYVATVIVGGASVLFAFFPTSYPRPFLFAILLVTGCLTSLWKVNLPISLASGSTLSVSYAADLMSLLLLGPRHAVVVAVAGVWAQCTFKIKRSYPPYRMLFSVAAEAITMTATGLVFVSLGGRTGVLEFASLAKPLVGAIATYFFVNTGLVAGAIALSTGRTLWNVWHDDFLWSGASFMVAGSAGALAAAVIQRGDHWKAVLMVAPVYLTYRTYQIFVGRLEDEKRHLAETERLHQKTIDALTQARQAERALADEKERLARTLSEMTRLEQLRNHLLEREHAARASAEQANRLKDQFLAIVSHELRTPLNAVLGWAEMLRHGTISEARRERAFQAIYDGARRQAQLIDDLLDVARIMSGKLRLARTTVDVNDIVRAAMELVQPAADAKRIQVTLDRDPAAGAIYGDGARLQQIVWNLLTNAVKFTPEGGAIHVGLGRVDGMVEVKVTDTGQGIPNDFLQSMFEPFRQADASTTRAHGGLGLGLAIVKHLAEAHGGSVTAESGGEGQGATFRVRLPVGSPAEGTEPVPAAPLAADAAVDRTTSLDGLTVLVVDDDRESRDVVATYLETYRVRVLTAASASQALRVLQREHVDVLLADIAMPGEDGYTLIRKVRALNGAGRSSIPAVALTAFARHEDQQQALRAGFQLHLAKPVDTESLIAAVASLAKSNQTPIRT